MREHVAGHDLPISNGFSPSDGQINVYCGRCDGRYAATPYWAWRYLERLAGQLRREIDRGHLTPIGGQKALDMVLVRFRDANLDVTPPDLQASPPG